MEVIIVQLWLILSSVCWCKTSWRKKNKIELSAKSNVFLTELMKFQILSDLHLEFLKKTPIFPVLADYLLLAGDIGYPGSPIWVDFINQVTKNYKCVFYVAGNHEYYGKSILEVKAILKETPGICYLDNEWADIEGTNVRIIGSTLWTDVADEDIYYVARSMNDYKKIRYAARPLRVQDTNEFHLESRKYLDEAISACEEAGKEAIVMTHHLPSYKMIHDTYKGDPMNCAFASGCDDLIRGPVKLWVCGHSHMAVERDINGAKVVLAPIGYPSEVRANIPKLCVADISEDGVRIEWH